LRNSNSTKRESMQLFPEFSDKFADSPLLDSSLYRDLAWAIVNTIGADCLQDLGFEYEKESLQDVGSWTAFMKDTSKAVTQKSKIEYLPVIPFPPNDNVVKYYLDMTLLLRHDTTTSTTRTYDHVA